MSVRWLKTLANRKKSSASGSSCRAVFSGEDSDMNVQGTAISLDSESQATEIAPTEGIRNSGCGHFVLCR